MKIVGITGGIGAGKSIVCRVLGTLDIPIYAADERAKWLTQHDPVLRADIIRLLGAQAYDALGNYNRGYVAAQVFTNPDRLAQLNALIHPRVFADTDRWVRAQQQVPYVVKEAALMRAAGDQNDLDAVVVVTAPLTLRIERIRHRDPQRTESEIKSIIDRQISEEERLQLADYVLVNNEVELLLPQILELDALLRGKG